MSFTNQLYPLELAFVPDHDPGLVIVSLLFALCGTYTALAILGPIRGATTAFKRGLWLTFGSLALSGGIFGMHFVGMIAYRLPIPVHFATDLTLLSLLPALLSSALMLYLLGIRTPFGRRSNRIMASVVLGVGVAAMDYTAMKAMQLEATMILNPLLFTLALITTPILSTIALNSRPLAQRLEGKFPLFSRFLSPFILAGAIASLHYLMLAATRFFPGG
ncbi:MAG: hypothetical protein HQL48_04570, partial [Gammaproteobacteria bacterium]|nr:hypothetical protein [Gammaproteobacteria bacterium]